MGGGRGENKKDRKRDEQTVLFKQSYKVINVWVELIKQLPACGKRLNLPSVRNVCIRILA